MTTLADQTRWMDLTDKTHLVTTGQVSARELLEATIERIDELDPHLGALTLRTDDQARTVADTAPTGPLAGVPFLIKDLFTDVAGQVCSDANVALKRVARPAEYDGPLPAALRAAGAVFVGRTASSEFGSLPTAESLAWGATRNPWDVTRTTGGSSGGSAAAVAAGMVPAAHATDAAGSIRVPASCCGLVGLKTSRPATSGAPTSAADLITELAVTRSVRDTATLLAVLQGPVQERSGDRSKLRIGLLDSRFDGSPVHPACHTAVRATATLLEELGHHVEPGFPPALSEDTLGQLFTAFFSTGVADIFTGLAQSLGRPVQESDVEPLNWALARMAETVGPEERRRGFAATPAFVDAVVSWWDGHDLLLTPTLAEPPVPLGTFASDPDEPLRPLAAGQAFAEFTPFVNMTGQPAISLPLHTDENGLPVGIQLVAAPGREDLLLHVAAELEAALPWRDRHPTL